MFNPISRIALAALAVAAGGTQAAFALEATDFADKLSATSRLMGISLDYASATAEGDTVTISDFTLTVPGEDAIEIPGAVVFEGVVETPEGGFTAARATIADVEYTDEDSGVTLSFVNIAAEGITLPAEPSLDSLLEIGLALYERISAGPLTVSDADGTELFAIELIDIWTDEADAEGGVGSGYAITGIRADLSAIDEEEAQEVIAAFGVEELSAEMGGYGIWWPETGRLELSDVSFTLHDLGTARFAFAAEGYTRELYDELIKINIKMVELAEAGEELDDAQMAQIEQAMLASFSDLKLAGGSFRYEDDSLFMKILDYVGAEQGTDGATFAAGLKFMVPMALVEVEDAEFKAMVTEAVNTFVDDPQNFTISIEPDEPIAFTDFEAIDVEADPFVLVDLLNLTITANQ